MQDIHRLLQQDLSQLPDLLAKAQKQATAYLESLHERPTSSNHPFPAPIALPETGLGTARALELFGQDFEPTLVASSGPRYWGFVTGGSTPAALLGDWLTSAYDPNAFSTQGQGDLSGRIEQATIELLRELFGLPDDFVGGFVTGATMSNFTCLAVARQWIGRKKGKDFAKEGVSGPVPVLSAVPHSSAIKALSLLGLGSNNLIKVAALPGNREAIDLQDLQRKLDALNGSPCVILASGGTVNTVDFDDLRALCELKNRYDCWIHVDAAFGGFAACSPQYRHLLAGWEMADSITVDCHKWLNVPYESAIFLVKKEHGLLQIETFQNSQAPYLGDPLANFSYINFLPENSRRLKALPAWFSLMAYGKEGYREIVERCIALAQLLGSEIERIPGFALLAPVRLNTVCFHYQQVPGQTTTILQRLNATGKVFMTPTVYNGTAGIRAALVNWRTTQADIEIAVTALRESVGIR